MTLASDLLESVARQTEDEFSSRNTLLSFDAYLDEVCEHPKLHLRNAAGYMLDVVEHFGTTERVLPTGTFQRYRLFDAAFDNGERRVIGQERVQDHLVRLLKNFLRAGRIDRLILLHGPNGSAKTSLIQGLTRAAEIYSETNEGALYRFNWVFPVGQVAKGSLGFGGEKSKGHGSYAHLSGTEIEARLPCELKDHPLFLLTPSQRQQIVDRLIEEGKLERGFTLPDFLRRGGLSSKNRRVFEAMMTHYRGDIREVFRHVQVERFYLSRRYRRGVVAVEPQMSVDAYARQITADRSLGALPAALQHVALFETGGALNDANRGILEFNDLLKRPLETWKYLLVATEQAQASLDHTPIFLDVLMLASSNDVHLEAFKQMPDWPSFKGRIELVTVPYLLRVSDELCIYKDQVPQALTGVHIAPHALEVAARWAVLTRLEPPDPESYDDAHRELVAGLSPEEKLELYDSGAVPERLSQKERRELRQIAGAVYSEYVTGVDYEGRMGASVREVRSVLLNAAQDGRFDHLSPVAVLDELDALCKETSSYPFLRRESANGYRDAPAFVEQVRTWYLGILDEDVRSAMGLVAEGSHTELFERYVKNVSAWTKKERLEDPLTGKSRDPDEDLMKSVEDVLLADEEDSDDFRRALISQIGAQKLEHPDDDVDYDLLFGSYLRRLKEDFFNQRRTVVERIERGFLRVLDDDTADIEAKDLELIEALREGLYARGYNESSARHAVAPLLKMRT